MRGQRVIYKESLLLKGESEKSIFGLTRYYTYTYIYICFLQYKEMNQFYDADVLIHCFPCFCDINGYMV